MRRTFVTRLPPDLVFLASRTAPEFPQTGFAIDRSVLPVSIAAEDDHTGVLGQFIAQLTTFVSEDVIGMVVLFTRFVWPDQRSR